MNETIDDVEVPPYLLIADLADVLQWSHDKTLRFFQTEAKAVKMGHRWVVPSPAIEEAFPDLYEAIMVRAIRKAAEKHEAHVAHGKRAWLSWSRRNVEGSVSAAGSPGVRSPKPAADG